MENSHKIDKENVEDMLAVTPMQAGMLFHYFSEQGSGVYFDQSCYSLKGLIKSDSLKKAWNYVIQNNEMLRTVFRWKGMRLPIQIILKKYDIPISEYDFSVLSTAEKQSCLEDVLLQDRRELVDIETKPFRVILCKLSDDEYKMIVSTHHVIHDGWSNAVLLKELLYAYREYLNGREPQKSEKIKYKELVKWYQKQDKSKQKLYWENYLKGYISKNFLGTSTTQKSMGESGKYSYIMDSEVVNAAYKFIRQEQITLSALIYSTWGILLHKYSGYEDIVFGVTMSGRTSDIARVENIVGLFINTLPIRLQVKGDSNIGGILKEINNSIISLEEYQGTPLFDVKQYSSVGRDGQLFDTLVVVQNYPVDTGMEDDSQYMSITFASSYYLTNFNISLGVRPFKGIQLDLDFDSTNFDTKSVEMLCGRFIKIVEKIACNYRQDMKVKDIEIFDLSDGGSVLNDIHNTLNNLKKFEEVDFDEVF